MIFFAALIGFALFGGIAPYTLWKITLSWKATKEPTKSYFIIQRIMGYIFFSIRSNLGQMGFELKPDELKALADLNFILAMGGYPYDNSLGRNNKRLHTIYTHPVERRARF
ncbi:DUF6199 family natural product biosynthesis protein [Paenibacillus sp. N3.4]|uniref:DUF6199 family natural product biosynthesis protein n=1 Tax=Paenibacillus sp. N3.4 TaxID=2603222 RepID=UPI0037C95873